MNFKTILAPAVALTMALTNPLQAKAEVTLADQVTAAFSISLCLQEYGRTQDTAQTLFEAGVSKLPEQHVINVMNHSQFQQRVKNHIAGSGGCGALVDMVEKRVATYRRTGA